MPPYIDLFLTPVRDNLVAQVAVEAMILLSLLDVVMGWANASFIQHDYSSHIFREGITRKLMNLGMVCAASVVDTMLISGMDLAALPIGIPDGSVIVAFSLAFCGMEMSSLLEIYAESHPDVSDAPWYQMLVRSKDGLEEAKK